MQGFKDFVMRGNLVELAVAFIIATSFAEVVKTFTAIILALLGKLGGTPNFDKFAPGGVPVGVFLTALLAFLILAAVVYFGVVKPYEAAKARFARDPKVVEVASPEAVLLTEIRDLLSAPRV
jgi:large conductance mechanosensitive channel